MSAIVNGEFHLQETWIVQGSARDYRSDALDLTGATISLRFATSKGQVLLTLETPTGGSIINAEDGTYEFVIDPDQQEAAEIGVGALKYEIKVTTALGTVSIQNVGTITVLPSLFAEA